MRTPILRLVTPEFIEEYFTGNQPDHIFPLSCERVEKRIECLRCHYPASEAYYWHSPTQLGLVSGPNGEVMMDPGCKYE